jgi:hypothetical protein
VRGIASLRSQRRAFGAYAVLAGSILRNGAKQYRFAYVLFPIVPTLRVGTQDRDASRPAVCFLILSAGRDACATSGAARLLIFKQYSFKSHTKRYILSKYAGLLLILMNLCVSQKE